MFFYFFLARKKKTKPHSHPTADAGETPDTVCGLGQEKKKIQKKADYRALKRSVVTLSRLPSASPSSRVGM